VAELGGDLDLAQQAAQWRQGQDSIGLVGHHAIVGVSQPTSQSLILRDGLVQPQWYTLDGVPEQPSRVDREGDGTVSRDCAVLPDAGLIPQAQQHGSLARTEEAIRAVLTVLTEREPPGPPMGLGELGLDLPDLVEPDQEWQAVITGGAAPHTTRCFVTDVATGRDVAAPRLERRDGQLVAPVRLPRPGLFRVRAAGSGSSPVQQLVLATDPDL
jgi:hypothetical protein